MAVEKYEYQVKVSSDLFAPLIWPREAVMLLSESDATISFRFNEEQLVLPFGRFSGLPWSSPFGNSMLFGLLGSGGLKLLVEFENRQDLIKVHELLKRKFLAYAQFLPPEMEFGQSACRRMSTKMFIDRERSVRVPNIDYKDVIGKPFNCIAILTPI
ncbi:unnamed protein product [Thelazia callipaeda]|uniref:IRS-type PTB domain-containing protein n=1 Tax=Thelazia callipaeda TaxID=103827 RepID=A0A0N5D9H7_THECL|nr:unnamed protein product [Thelazia callipaeda]